MASGVPTAALILAILLVVLIRLTLRRARSGGIERYDKRPPTTRNEYGIRCTTLNGEETDSHKEKIIADYFYRNNLPYELHPPVYSRRRRYRRFIGYADFLVLRYNIYVEYWGLADVDEPYKREEYNRRMRSKMAQYYQNGIVFISLYERDLADLDRAFRRELKKVTGIDFYSSTP
ncbi:MAG: hypothetical protein HRF40_03515 [Nitrososphaera sp.]